MKIRGMALVSVLLLALASLAQVKAAERVVDLKSSDGTRLKATFFAAGVSGPGILLSHQCNRDRRSWDTLARKLSASGMNVLTFDLRNYGESEGKPFDKLTQQEGQASAQKWGDDVEAALQYLEVQPGVKRDVIGLGGASCGVGNSVESARHHPEVKSLVLLAGPANLEGRNFLRHSTLPVLYGYADDDQFPPSVVITQWLYLLTPNPGKKLVTYPNGGHGAEIFSVHPEFEDVIKDWFVTTLIKTPGHAPDAKSVAVPKEIEILNTVDQPGGAAKVSKMLADARKNNPKTTLFPEAPVNLMGYEHMQVGDNNGAVEILKLNAEAYPDSTNVYDSLSDAYIAAGKKELALANVKRALEMLKTDTTTPQQLRDGIKASCEQKLKQLSAGPSE